MSKISKISKIIKPLLTRPKCFAHLYHPYTMVDICNCVDVCKYRPPPAVMNSISSDYLFIPDDDRVCYELTSEENCDKVA
jgi:hypothetical protein